MASKICPKCKKSLDIKNYYTRRDKTKLDLCKNCVTMHVNPYEEETFTWILKDLDLPYSESAWSETVEKEWKRALDKNPSNPIIKPAPLMGKYISKMKLAQFKKYTWEDSEALNAELRAKRAEMERSQQQIKQDYEDGRISESEYRTLASSFEQEQQIRQSGNAPTFVVEDNNPYQQQNFIEEEALPDIGAQLTQQDKIELALRWGRMYQPHEWVTMESMYQDFSKAFDVRDPARMDTLKKICKTSLKMDQALDCGDSDSYNKLARTYDALMKSGKFTEAQKKEEASGKFDSVGQIVNFAESKKGGGKIARHKIEYPIDIVDQTMDKLKSYYKSLFFNDSTIGQQVVNYVKKLEIQRLKDQEKERFDEIGDYGLSDDEMIELREQEEYDRTLDKDSTLSAFDKLRGGLK